MKVAVYRNTNKGCLSVRALEGAEKGLVVAHVEQIMLKDCGFRVSEAARRRVIETKRKSVHASVVGEVEAVWGAILREDISNSTIKGLSVGKPFTPIDGEKVYYNPYNTKTFIRVRDRAPVKRADRVHIDNDVVLATGLA